MKQYLKGDQESEVTTSGKNFRLKTWFLGMYFITQDKKGISARELMGRLGISYKAAWRMKQKLMQVMMDRC